MTGLWLASYIALWVLVMVLAVVLLATLRNLGLVYDRLAIAAPRSAPTRLVAGKVLPDIALQDAGGQPVTMAALSGRPASIAIVSAGCQHCVKLLGEIRAGLVPPDPLDASVTDWVFVGTGDITPIAAELNAVAAAKSARLFLDPTGQVAELWGVEGVPVMVVVDEALRVVRQSVGHVQAAAS